MSTPEPETVTAAAPRFATTGRVVVKVGSSSLRDGEGRLDTELVATLVTQLAELHAGGREVVLVSSGAVAAGLPVLGLSRRPTDLAGLQAAASVGQGVLMHTYQAAFARHGIACGQVLLTPDDVVDRARYLNARTTFDTLLAYRAVPVVNENDTVATDELRFSDNDRLAALVASMLRAEVLVLLSDVDGLLDGDPATAAELPVVGRVDDLTSLRADHYGLATSAVGRGGMASKLEAARIATFSGAHAVIANARRADVVSAAVGGAAVGTWFPPARRRPESRKLWIAFAHTPRGAVTVDAGARRALVDGGSSLLAAGIVAVRGDFAAGDAIDVIDTDGRLVARGLVGYPADTVERMRGRSTSMLRDELGMGYERAVIHRDQLVVVVA